MSSVTVARDFRAGGALTESWPHHKVESRAVRVCLSVCMYKTFWYSRAKLGGLNIMGPLLRSKAPKSAPVHGLRSLVDPLWRFAHRLD